MADEIKLTVTHEDFPDLAGPNTVETLVKVDGGLPAGIDALIEAVLENYEDGLKSVAGAHIVDYDSFRSDSAYLDSIDAVVREMTVVGIAVPGAEAEADFAALWTEAKSGASAKATVEDVLYAMAELVEDREPEAAAGP